MAGVRILLWHVHGSWTTAFVQGRHEYVVPVTPDRGPDGVGRARSWDWPASVREVGPDRLADEPFDVVVLQRPHEEALVREWAGRRPGRDVPAIYLEHNAPTGHAATTEHPVAGRTDLRLVHVTHFNDLFWDAGGTPTTVIEHGIVDPGYRWTGEIRRAAVVVNEPVRRARITGTDLLPGFAREAPLDVFGMGTDGLADHLALAPARLRSYNLSQAELHDAMARRRVYLHPIRWTSLGLSLLEAMHLGMPVVALATTEVVEAVPPEAGAVSTSPERLGRALAELVHDADAAQAAGRVAREAALQRYGLTRFLADWDAVLHEVTA
jgi:hypothetical protein